MDKEDLRKFLVAAHQAGYIVGDEKRWTKEVDGSTTIKFTQGDWTHSDNFFGGEPFGGRILVTYKSKPVWIMVYYGWVEADVDLNQFYKLLRNALKLMPESAPFRGPELYQEQEYTYKNHWTGGLERYNGEDQIHKGDKLVYQANYFGGFVDQRAGV